MFYLVSSDNRWDYSFNDYTNHPCRRKCDASSQPYVCHYEWTVENFYVMSKACYSCPYNQSHCYLPHCIAGDGWARGIKVVNRMLPGPAIEVCQNDTIQVTVYNRLESSEGTSIHWHGILQHGTPYMDGVSMVTQCPIPFNAKFTYRFKVETSGTHFWHGHAGAQRADGLFGPLIVRLPEVNEPYHLLYDFDLSEHVILINDWTVDMMTNRLAKYVHFDYDNKPKQMFINGRGEYQGYLNKTTNETTFTPRSSFTVTPGKKYRFRLISAGIANCPIQFSIDDHTMNVIASDGNYLKPFITDSITINGGERFDFILFADKTSALRQYWIRTRGYNNCANFKAGQTAILKYDGAPNELPPEPTQWENGIRDGIHLNPAFPVPPNGSAEIKDMKSYDDGDIDLLTSIPDKKFYLAIDFVPIDNLRAHHLQFYPFNASSKFYSPQINFITSEMPQSPPLTQFDDVPQSEYCNAETVQKQCTKEWCACVHMYQVALGDLVELVIVDEGKPAHAYHPLHLHGHRFRVVAMDRLGDSVSMDTIKELDKNGLINRTTSNAPLKDTIIIPDGGYTILRFRADNPGIWLFHCHIEFHAETGMSLVFQVGNKTQFPKVPKNFPKCGDWEFQGFDEDEVKVTTQEVTTEGVTCPSVEGGDGESAAGKNIFSFSAVVFMLVLECFVFQ
ncbi:uncharacterized protein LOC131928383 [Physella acuta]|uniref:uncharacterized protein LOC131928383 n=1 Tax=Physella acuta TaxID=109671 RepID=UPI0027DD17F0|nr:uncharacterized protein LOC131928383 [Physella acuta]